MSVFELQIGAPADAALARAAARRAGAEAELEPAACAQMVLAVSRLVDPFLLGEGRCGRIRIEVPCSDGRPGVELAASRRCSEWGVDLPPISELMDELDAGFTPEGDVRVWGRKWRRTSRRAPVQAARGGRPSLSA